MKKIVFVLATSVFIFACSANKEVVVEKEEVVETEQVLKQEVVEPIVVEEKEVEPIVIEPLEIEPAEFVVVPVQSGDNIYNFALEKNLYIWQIADLNQIDDPSKISNGQDLKLPAVKKRAEKIVGNQYRVDLGDNLNKISKESDVSQEELIQLNGIVDVDRIGAGSLLQIR